jgi:hypothetical protein
VADRAYSSRAIRTHLRRWGIRAVIPQPSDQVGHRLRRGRLGGRPPDIDSDAYKQRNTSSGASTASSSGAAWPHEPKEQWLAAKHAEERQAAAEWAAQFDMPPLEGPERALRWGERSRHQLMVAAHTALVVGRTRMLRRPGPLRTRRP